VKKADPKEVGRLIASECLSVRVRRLGREITRIYAPALAPHGVSAAQLNLLAAIAAADGARPGDLTRLLDLEKSTLSRDLKRMERLGWVRSGTVAARRGQFVSLTPAGSRLLVEVRGAWQKAQAAAEAELGERPYAQLRAALPSPLSLVSHRRAAPRPRAPSPSRARRARSAAPAIPAR
jgi:DNA-binding MarR family transcriptional regulator